MSTLFLLYPHIFPPESLLLVSRKKDLSLARPVCYEMCPLLRTQETDSVKLLRHYVREFVRKTGATPWIKPSTKSLFNLPQNLRNHSIVSAWVWVFTSVIFFQMVHTPSLFKGNKLFWANSVSPKIVGAKVWKNSSGLGLEFGVTLLLDERSIESSGAQEKEGHFH